jgi:hypothetical protein
MKKLFTILSLALSLSLIGQTPSLGWAKSISCNVGGSGGRAITTDASENIISAGIFGSSNQDFDPGPATFTLPVYNVKNNYIHKMSATGNFIWAKNVALGSDYIRVRDITTDAAGNIYYCGEFGGVADFDPSAATATLAAAGVYSTSSNQSYDAFICKLDANGNYVWAKRIGQIWEDRAGAIALDNNGNVYVTGNFIGVVDFDPGVAVASFTSLGSGSGGNDPYLLKLDNNGNFVYVKHFKVTTYNEGNSLEIDNQGNIFLGGYNNGGGGDFDPGPGVANITTPGNNQQFFIVKLNSLGNFIWVKSTTGSAAKMSIDKTNGSVYIAGQFSSNIDDFNPSAASFTLMPVNNTFDIFVSKLDSTGNFLWAKGMGGAYNERLKDMGVDALGDVYTTGVFGYSYPADFDPGIGTAFPNEFGGTDIFISKLNASGNFVWVAGIGDQLSNDGDESGDGGVSIAISTQGNVYTTGITGIVTDFDPTATSYYWPSCGSFTYITFIQKLNQVGAFGINEKNLEQISFSIYPNPSNTVVTIELPEFKKEATTITITDIMGKYITSKTSTETATQLNVSEFKSGVYFITLKSDSKIATQKLIIQ